jgi:hypothetical protein
MEERQFPQLDWPFDGAVAQLVEHLLCKKNALSAVLAGLSGGNLVSESMTIRCSSFRPLSLYVNTSSSVHEASRLKSSSA